jgi:phosphoglycolate phosphatase
MAKNKPIIIFDFDGTLANSVGLMIDLYNEHAVEFNYQPVALSEFPTLRRMGYRKALKSKGIKYRVLPKMAKIIASQMHGRMNEVKPYDGIIRTLEELMSEGYSIGVLTSNQASLVKDFLKVHKFPEFDFVVSEKTIFGKDKALKRIIHRYDLSREQIVYVGDEPRDVQASLKAGVSVVAVTWGLGGKEGFDSVTPTAIVNSPKELKETIINLTSG